MGRQKQKDTVFTAFLIMAEEEGFEPPGPFRAQRFSRRVIALWLASNLLTTNDDARLDLGGLDTVGGSLG